VRVYALSLEPADTLRELQERLGTAVTLLSDPSGEAAEAFGVLDPRPFPSRTMARAASFHVDREGMVRHRFLEGSYRERPDPGEILSALGR